MDDPASRIFACVEVEGVARLCVTRSLHRLDKIDESPTMHALQSMHEVIRGQLDDTQYRRFIEGEPAAERGTPWPIHGRGGKATSPRVPAAREIIERPWIPHSEAFCCCGGPGFTQSHSFQAASASSVFFG